MASLKLGDWVEEVPGGPGIPVTGTPGTATIFGKTYPTTVIGDYEWTALDLDVGTETALYGVSLKAPNAVTGVDSYFWQPTSGSLGVLSAQVATLAGGWRLPNEADALAFIDASGPDWDSRVKALRSNIGWTTPVTGANNSTGFSALGSGRKGFYLNLEFPGTWFSYAIWPNVGGRYLSLRLSRDYGNILSRDTAPEFGNSVRLVRDYVAPPLPPSYASGIHDLLVLPNGRAETTESLAQRIDIRLRTFAGEHWLNPELGIPWFRDFLTKSPDLSVCRQVLWDTILGVQGVQTINRLDLAINKATRVLTVTFVVNGTDSFTSTITV